MNRQSSAHVTAFNRASVIVVLIALLAPPLMLLTDLSRSSAKGKRPKAAANTAPPPAYDFSSKAPGIASNLIERVSEKTNAAWEYVTAPELPEGFENATPVSPLYESVSSAIGSVTSLGSPPRASAATLAAGDVSFDFEGDGKADAARWNPGSFEYLIKKSNGSGYQTETIGTSVSTPVPGDFDADGKTDAATFTAGLWTVRKSSGGADVLYNWGVSGDVPVAGDYDGDGKSDYAIVRTETSGSKTWWIHNSATGGYSTTSFGTTGDILVPGNYDGDSQTDIAVFRGGVWHVLGSSAGYYTFGWGVASDTPVPADYDADGKTDFAIFRPGTGTWWVYYSNTSTYLAFGWGNYGDQPVPADYDGDNKADYAVWRPTTGVWYIHESSTGTFKYESLGLSGDTPAEAAYLKKVGSLHSKYDFAKDRLAPINAAGGTNLYSRNFSWGAALVALPGRAGFNAGFGISYNSLVWTKDTENDVMVFDPDVSNVSPGFRMGFATIEPAYYDKGNGRFSFLMVTPSGARVEFKQIGATSRYETQDSTYALLELDVGDDPNDPPDEIGITVTTTDGTRTAYEWKAGAFRAKEIKDRNGNYVLVAHDEYGLLDTVTDTLGRIIEVHYDYELYPTSVTQQWKTGNGAGSTVTHTYATFTYGDIQVDPDFDSSLGVFGPDGGTDVKSLTRVTYADSSATEFDYNDYGQVEKVTNKAPDSHILNYTSTNLDTPGTGLSDVPRFSETRNWVENFNIVSGSEQEVVYTNTFTTGQTIPDVGGTGTLIQVSMTGHPTSNTSKTYVGETGWMESLPIISEDWADSGSGLTRKRWSTSLWTQDDTNLAYINNPRVTETKIGDDEIAAVRRSTTEYRIVPYTNIAEYGLVESVKVYDSDQSTVLMEVQTDYNLSSAYTDRRIIGLPSEVRGYGFENSQLALVSKVTYGYDEENFTFETNQVPNIGTGHDATNYGSAFVTGRANLTSATRHDVTGQTASVTSKTRYDIAGSPVASLDPLNRKVRTEYTDNFNDASNPGTFAYPTKVIDPAGEYSRVQYRFDIGANVWADSPHPSNSQNRGKETTRAYDSLGRLERQTLVNTGAYTRYVYPSSQVRSEVYTTIVDTNGNGADSADEVLSESLFDGAGRTLQSRTEHPGSTGGFAGSIAEYNKLGQLKRSTVPTEITSSYTPTGDDTSWLWQEKEYDWNGRVVREINTDGTDRLISYSGCGCAGITETTIESESVPRDDIPTQNARRKQKVYTDILGRNFKTEIYNWTGGVYTTTVQTFNGRDQVISTEQFEGTANPANTKQTVTTTYDGHGRMKTRHYPIEDSNAYTEWNYNSDDTVHQLIDPRLVIKQFTYEAERGLLEKIEYLPPAGITDTPDVIYDHDNLGNRISMDDGTGDTTYSYDELSRLTSESVALDDLPSAPVPSNRYTTNYTYNYSGMLLSVTDPFDHTVDYGYNKTGSLLTVKGDGTTSNPTGDYISDIKFRAFGNMKQLDYKLPSETAQIKMEYDDRQVIDHIEAPASTESSGFILKSDYTYAADMRILSRDDLIEDKFDRSFKHDFAGRRVFEQWGMGLNSNQWMVRVFEQSTTFDAFSMMTNVSGTHWDSDIGYANTYIDGRIQGQPGPEYDAAGNIIGSGETGSQFDFQNTDFDAAGNKIEFHSSARGRMGSMLNMVTESLNEYEFDGEGRPIKETSGIAIYHESEQNPPDPDMTVYGYQVWSSVMGKQLTSLRPDGTRLNTSVYAGGTLIAKQTDTGNSWQITDPITGSKATYAYNGTATKEEFSGLGQKVSDQDPAEFPDPPANEIVSFWENMQWQCTEVPQEFWGSFGSMPFHCQMAILMNTNILLPDIYGWSYEVRVEKQEREEKLRLTSFNSLSDSIMSFGLKASAKPIGRDGGTLKPGDPCTTTSGEKGRADKNGNCLPEKGTVNVTSWIDMGEIPGFVWSEVSTLTPEETSCERFANDVERTALGRDDDLHGFLDQMAREFLGVKNSSLAELRRSKTVPGAKRYGEIESGWKDELNDKTGLQHRHFVGGLLFGFKFGSWFSEPALNHREGDILGSSNNPDVLLNGLSTDLGANIRPTIPAHMEVRKVYNRATGYEKKKTWVKKQIGNIDTLADWIRNNLCAK